MNARLNRQQNWESDDFARSMRAALDGRLAEHRNTGDVEMIAFADPREGLWLQCTVNQPKSMVGRTVSVFLDEADRESLFRALRDEMVRAREVTT